MGRALPGPRPASIPHRKNAAAASPGWTSGPANGCPSCPPSPPRPAPAPGHRRTPRRRPGRRAPGECSPPAARRCAAPCTTRATRGRIWAEDPGTGPRRDLTREEHRAFWAWAAVEVLRQTGIRVEELTELSHHSLVQYRLPATGELIPLLHIAPSKTDTERLLVISPELADVLSAPSSAGSATTTAPCRWWSPTTTTRQTWNPPMPLLFQRRVGLENRPISRDRPSASCWTSALAAAGLTDTTGQPLRFAPHDFRRIFITDAIMNGMPPHIAQLIAGHRDINTTMGYKAVYPEEAINGHRAFIARRRALRPSEEYRHPDRRGMGGVPRPLRPPQGRPRRLRPGLRHQLHPRAQLRPVPPAAPRPGPAAPARRHPRQPRRPASAKPSAKAGSARPKA